ncbi:tRNA (adenosine(37)-N6)-dimethylallyltransferase MiaA [Bhargavaea cecembensis]|uniref:tRNA (adenosine(37)-N6)-dimethylallyltransferase MiaA n=1 Tax=Bhargavaea cecembensis TaxID=394098 RepID=UPI000AE70C6D|nr:tRNA (adenosine(37)-N6)-dimethylallyltransferase MiaA [Bhargavaea cecembensis]
MGTEVNGRPDVVAIIGPTASGKTALSVRLAESAGGEVINGDALQVYRGLDIGTAKITQEEKRDVPHHLFDILEPSERFSVADYQFRVREKIREIRERGRLPILVGGTGLYVQAVLYDFRFTEEKTDARYREEMERLLEAEGPGALHAELARLDPGAAAGIHPNNVRRVLRALDIIGVSGHAKAEQEGGGGRDPVYRHLLVGLDMDREKLYGRINRRLDLMMERGLTEEVEKLIGAGLADSQSMRAIGYREIASVLAGERTMEEALELAKRNTRRYAKRQLTYFRNKLDVHWLDAEDGTEKNLTEILKLLKEFEDGSRT